MRHLAYILLIVTFLETGCCVIRQLDQPQPPEHVRGWKDERVGNSIFIGEFILKKGESADNGHVGVKLVDIEHRPCESLLSAEDSDPEIKLQFYDPRNKRVLCETPFISGGLWGFDAIRGCNKRLPITGMVVYKINSEDNWIHMALFKDVKEPNK